MNRLRTASRWFYAFLFGEDSLDRACRDIPESSCHEQRFNFTLNVANGASTKLAEQVAGPNLVLVWLLQVIGSPLWMLGFLMPIKQTASLLPQMVAAGQIRQLAVRKWVWTVAALVQTVCLLGILAAALLLPPAWAGGMILLLFTLFCMASGTASVAFQDVLGKTIAKGRRGKLLASRALIGGVLTLLVGAGLSRLKGVAEPLVVIQWLLIAGAVLWAIGALLFAAIREDAGATEGARSPVSEIRHGAQFFVRYPGFRRFLFARALLLCIELAPPFYFMHVNSLWAVQGSDVGFLVAAVGFSQLVSSPFWGRMADETSRRVMFYSAAIATLAGVLALLLSWVPSHALQKGAYLLVFILIGLADSGVRLGRKTYMVDAVPPAERATFAALTNSVVGVLALLFGVLGLIAQSFGVLTLIALLAVLTAVAACLCRIMPEAEQMLDGDTNAA
ncbi:MAG: MFS transporter [Desulfuromonadaceae bacterium]|nr:MFS transporter [Desulfuromonadaceae bacterium]